MNEHIGDSDMPDIKGDASATKSFVDGVIPELDHGRVYNSDLKKLVQWFSILKSNDCFPLESQKDEETTTEAAAEEASTEEKEPKAKKAPAKKTAAKKAPAKKAATKKTAAPKAAAKKSTAKKSPASKAKK
jgi:cobalamin-dependent methionine synthase I